MRSRLLAEIDGDYFSHPEAEKILSLRPLVFLYDFSKLCFWPNLGCPGRGKTLEEEAWAQDVFTSYREGKAKAQKGGHKAQPAVNWKGH